MKNPKLVIGIIAILVLLIIFFLVYKNSKKVTTEKGGTSVQQGSFLDSILSTLGVGGSKSTSNSGGGGNVVSALLCKINPKSCPPKPFDCDCKNPGYDIQGDLRSTCTEGIGASWIKECK